MNWYLFLDVIAWGVAGLGLVYTLKTLIVERILYITPFFATLIAIAYLIARL